jgi:hypothetical protein
MPELDTQKLRSAAQDACNARALTYLWHGIILDPQSPAGVRYDVIGRKPESQGAGKVRFTLPVEQAEELTAALGEAFTSPADLKKQETLSLPQANKKNAPQR